MDAYFYQSPIGGLEIIANSEHLIAINFKEGLSEKTENKIIKQCIEELDAYFDRTLQNFSVPIQLSGTDFQNNVWSKLIEIPYGKSINYSQLAIQLGDIKCIRAAGTANGKNKIPIIIPCHRVIGKDGSLVGFSGGLDRKKWLLKHEGVIRGEQKEIFS